MKTPLLLSLVSLLALAPSLSAAKEPASAARVTVSFHEPEKFTDVNDAEFGTESGRNAFLEELRSFIVNRAPSFLPANFSLAVTFTDIDLAGDFEPWHGPPLQDVRLVRDIYPPRLKFSYEVRNAADEIVLSGDRDLLDLTFMTRLTANRHDPLRYEKDILMDWIRSDLRSLKTR